MQAIILAAGLGSRLQKVTGGKSKALIDVGGRPLILHQLEALADHGVGPVLVIVGHQADEVQQVIGDRAETLLNDRFATTNSLYSLWLARDWIKGEFVLLNCDLFFDPRILDRLLEAPGNVVAYDSTSSRGREQTKVAVRKRRVVDLGKDVPPASARGESLGLLKFDPEGARAMIATANHLIGDGHEDAWVIEATRAVCAQLPVYGVNVAGHAWTEIDYPYDLDVARREVWPVIWRGRWRKQIYWRRTRWVALAAAAVALALTGWIAKSALDERDIDWETVSASGGEVVRLTRADGKSQRWWLVTDTVVAAVSGSAALIETRLLMPENQVNDSVHYVVAIELDRKPHDWRVRTAVIDPGIRMGTRPVGDRDKIDVAFPVGTHEIRIALVATQGGSLLVRVRQEETPD